MRLSATTLAALIGLSLFRLTSAEFVAAAPTEPTAQASDHSQAEIPAVPYVTLALARDASVHTELDLKPSQIEKVQAAIAQVDESFWRLRDVPVNRCADQLDALHSQLTAELKLEMTPPQFSRFAEIVLQARSWKALASPDISQQLKLTPGQLVKLRKALNDAVKERETMETQNSGKPASVQEKSRSKLRDTDTRRFTEILTPEQRIAYRSQLGEAFDFSRMIQVGCVAPTLRTGAAWINTAPIRLEDLKGKVVVVHFWAFGCINCIRNLPHYQSWHEQFGKQGVVVLGVHTPETERERQLDNLQRNVVERNIAYPVLFDAASENWKAWGNDMWPSVYLVDKQGRVRNWWYGELNWNGAKGEEFFRKRIEELLAEK